MELARCVGKRDAIAGDHAGPGGLERAPRCTGRCPVEARIVGKGRARDEGSPVGRGRIVLVTQIEFGLLRIAAKERDIAPAATEIEPDEAIDGELTQIGAFRPAILRVEGCPGEVGFEYVVDDARNGIRPIERRRAIAQHLDALDRADGDGVGVKAEGRHAGIDHPGNRLRCGMQDGAAAIDQQQRIALTQAAQRHGGYVATRGIARSAAQHLLIEGHAAELRDGAEQVRAGNGRDGIDLFLTDDGDGQGTRCLRAPDLGADDDDFGAAFALRLGGQPHGRRVRHGAARLQLRKRNRLQRRDRAGFGAEAAIAQGDDIVAVGGDDEIGAPDDMLERLPRIMRAIETGRATVAQFLGRRDDLQAALQREGGQRIHRAAFWQVEIALLGAGCPTCQRQCSGAAPQQHGKDLRLVHHVPPFPSHTDARQRTHAAKAPRDGRSLTENSVSGPTHSPGQAMPIGPFSGCPTSSPDHGLEANAAADHSGKTRERKISAIAPVTFFSCCSSGGFGRAFRCYRRSSM